MDDIHSPPQHVHVPCNVLWLLKSIFFPLKSPALSVIANFTTHGESHFYGLPCPSAESLDPMDHFCSFDVSKIIPKSMQKLPYATFKPFLVYIHGFDP